MKRVISVLLCMVLLFGLVPQVSATETSPYATIQFITQPTLNSEYEYGFENDTEGVLWNELTLQRVSVFGEPLEPPLDRRKYETLTDRLCYASSGGYQALFRRDGLARLTDYRYTEISVVGNYVRAKRTDETFDFFSLSGRKMPKVSLPEGYIVYAFVTDELVWAGTVPTYSYESKYYSLYDLSGRRLIDKKYSSMIERINDHLFYANGDVISSAGKIVAGGAVGYDTGFDDGGFLLRGRYSVYRMDADGRVVWQHDARDSHVAEGEEIQIVMGNYVIINNKASWSFMDEQGEVALPGEIIKMGSELYDSNGQSYWIPNGGTETPLFYTLTADQVYTVYNLRYEPILTLKNYKWIVIGGGYVQAVNADGNTELYDIEGKRCGDLVGSNYSHPGNGLMYGKLENEPYYAIINMEGDRVTEAKYSSVRSCNAYGLLLATRDGGAYFVNAAGQELNEEPISSYFRFGSLHTAGPQHSHYGCYQRDGKIGIVRFVEPGEGPFGDVLKKNWFSGAVEYCYDNGLMSGVGVGHFDPNGSATRAMLVKVLYNYAGEEPGQDFGYVDVEKDRWYTDAVNWATENGIVNGTGGNRFSPNKPITREQIVTILYRFSKENGVDVSGRSDLTTFPDAASVSSWAKDAMEWAVEVGLIAGKGGKLVPTGDASRAEIATILMRFTQMMQEKEPEKVS